MYYTITLYFKNGDTLIRTIEAYCPESAVWQLCSELLDELVVIEKEGEVIWTCGELQGKLDIDIKPLLPQQMSLAYIKALGDFFSKVEKISILEV